MKQWLSTILFAFALASGFAQVNIEQRIDTNFIRTGEPVSMLWTITFPDNALVPILFPDFKPTKDSKFEITHIGNRDTNKTETGTTVSQGIHLTSFDSGYQVTPPFYFMYNGDSLATETQLIHVWAPHVKPGLPPAVMPVHESVSLSFPIWLEINQYWIYSIIGLVILVLLIIKLIKNRKKKPTEEKVIPSITAYEEAVLALDLIEESKAWNTQKTKQYYTSLTGVLRTFIEREFNIPAHEFTSDEIISHFNYASNNDEVKSKLREVLLTSDMAKFAKANPSLIQNEKCFNLSRSFIYSFEKTVVSNEE